MTKHGGNFGDPATGNGGRFGYRNKCEFSFGRDEVVDVAPRYSASWDATLSRRVEVKEGWLELTLASINQSV